MKRALFLFPAILLTSAAQDSAVVECTKGEVYAIHAPERIENIVISNSELAQVKTSTDARTAYVKPLKDCEFTVFINCAEELYAVRFVPSAKSGPKIVDLPKKNESVKQSATPLFVLATALAKCETPDGATVTEFSPRVIAEGDAKITLEYRVEYDSFVAYVCRIENTSEESLHFSGAGFTGAAPRSCTTGARASLLVAGFTQVSLARGESCWGFFIFLAEEK